MTLLAGLIVIALAIYALTRQLDVRLVLALAGLALGAIKGVPMLIVQTFLATFSNGAFIIPICSAMGFAYVLKQTECDQHLVHLLVKPLRRAKMLVIPGAVLVGFVVNIPVVSQSSTIVCIGSVLVPLMRAANISAVTCGAALLLGCSIGGELLNPAAPEFTTIRNALGIDATVCVNRIFPLLIPHLLLATGAFWWLSARAEAKAEEAEHTVDGEKTEKTALDEKAPALGVAIRTREVLPENKGYGSETVEPTVFRVNLLKALVPLLPITLLFLASPPLRWISVPEEWLIDPRKEGGTNVFNSRLIGAAMLIGVVAAALTARGAAKRTAHAFFEGAGHAFSQIIAVIVTAQCFGKGVEVIGLADLIGTLVQATPGMLIPLAGVIPWGFAILCGSGMASTASVFGFFVEPSALAHVDAVDVGAVVSIAAAAGRTMSPVAPVVLMSAALAEANPLHLVRRVAVPLVLGVLLVVIAASMVVAGK